MANIVKLNYIADEINEKLGKITDEALTTGNGEIISKSPNLIDPAKFTEHMYLKWDGTLIEDTTDSNKYVTDFIPIQGGKTYYYHQYVIGSTSSLVGVRRVAFYNKEKNWISFFDENENATREFTTPKNAAFLRMSNSKWFKPMALYETHIDVFIPYYKHLAPDIELENHIDTTLTVEGKVADAKAVGDKVNFPYTEYGMPIVYFEGDTTGISKDDKVNLSYRYGDRQGTCTLKWQGSSSIAYPKKNYTVVFDNAFEAKEGWGEQKKYCLKANYIDFSHSRNICSARIWAGIVKERPNGYFGNIVIPSTPNYGAVDGFPCMVVINGEYQGLYTFNIPKDGWMMNMGSGNREAILCANGVTGTYIPTRFNATATEIESHFDLEYVSDENDADWVLESLNNMITACMNYDGSNYQALYEYIDVSSAIDYMIYLVALKAFDCIGKNYILATYDGVKWFFSAYDLDSTFGMWYDGTKFLEAYQTDKTGVDTFAKMSNENKLFNIIWNTPALKGELITRWNRQVRNIDNNGTETFARVIRRYLHPTKVEEIFYDFAKDIPKAVLDEEVKLWKGIPSTSVNNINQIISWYGKRIEAVNKELGL